MGDMLLVLLLNLAVKPPISHWHVLFATLNTQVINLRGTLHEKQQWYHRVREFPTTFTSALVQTHVPGHLIASGVPGRRRFSAVVKGKPWESVWGSPIDELHCAQTETLAVVFIWTIIRLWYQPREPEPTCNTFAPCTPSSFSHSTGEEMWAA